MTLANLFFCISYVLIRLHPICWSQFGLNGVYVHVYVIHLYMYLFEGKKPEVRLKWLNIIQSKKNFCTEFVALCTEIGP